MSQTIHVGRGTLARKGFHKPIIGKRTDTHKFGLGDDGQFAILGQYQR